jgi:hypothetical protein
MKKIKILSVIIVAFGYCTNTVAKEQQQSEQAPQSYSLEKSLNMYVFSANEQLKEQEELDEFELLKSINLYNYF